MDLRPPLPHIEHRRLAARFRALAANVTTARARGYLLGMADECDALAEGRIVLARPTFDDAVGKTALPNPFR
jgi:hypothetical protein